MRIPEPTRSRPRLICFWRNTVRTEPCSGPAKPLRRNTITFMVRRRTTQGSFTYPAPHEGIFAESLIREDGMPSSFSMTGAEQSSKPRTSFPLPGSTRGKEARTDGAVHIFRRDPIRAIILRPGQELPASFRPPRRPSTPRTARPSSRRRGQSGRIPSHRALPCTPPAGRP